MTETKLGEGEHEVEIEMILRTKITISGCARRELALEAAQQLVDQGQVDFNAQRDKYLIRIVGTNRSRRI